MATEKLKSNYKTQK